MHEIETFVNHIFLSEKYLKIMLINKITPYTYFATKERPKNINIKDFN